jgi:hypothetical protein
MIHLRIDITEVQAMLLANTNSNICNCPGDLPRDECLPSPWALVIEKNTVVRIHPVRLALLHGDPVCVQLDDTIWAMRVEWHGLVLRGLHDFSKSSKVEAW